MQAGAQKQMTADPLEVLSSPWVELLFHRSLRSKFLLHNHQWSLNFLQTVAGDEVEWLSCFLRDLLSKELQSVITIYCDNQATSDVTINSLFNIKK